MIVVRNLAKRYGDTEVLKGITIELRQGEFVCLLGLSGAGKTTLLRCLNGLVPSTSGAITVAGHFIDGAVELRHARRKIGFVFQHYNLVNRLSAIENVLTGLSGRVSTARSLFGLYSEEDRAFALECLKRTGIDHKADKRADTLSGGEKQRVALARALIQRPEVILADEPVSSVDPKIGRRILGLLQKIAKEDNITVLCNLHNVEMAKQFADRIIGMTNGVVVFDKPPGALDDSAFEMIYQTHTESAPGDDAETEDPESTVKTLPAPPSRPAPIDRDWQNVKYVSLGIVISGILVWSAIGAELSPYNLLIGMPHMMDFFVRMFPPDTEQLPKLVKPVVETLQIAIWGTLLAIVLSVPLGLLAARNITPWMPLYWLSRFILNICRGVSELVFALIFVAAVGLGPFPGVLALAVHNLGMLGKFYGDMIENVDPGPVDALYSTGATRLQMIRWAILPQVFPDFISFNLYRFEVSVRAASILGLVGAGGIGFPLLTSMRLFRYNETTTILILIVLMVAITDFIAGRLRQRII